MTPTIFLDGRVTLWAGDCLEVLKTLEPNSIDAVVTDPPYGLEFMGREWDKFVDAPRRVNDSGGRETPFAHHAVKLGGSRGKNFQAFSEAWAREVLRVLKPGGALLAFSGTRTYHRMACGIEDAGFEIVDQHAYCYGSGFPKSLNIALAFERMLCERRDKRWFYRDDGSAMASQPPFRHPEANEWWGWGTATKPAWEPICRARKPLEGTYIQNIARHGTGAINIDGCRVDGAPEATRFDPAKHNHEGWRFTDTGADTHARAKGRDGEPSADRRYIDKGSTNFAATPGPRGGDERGRWPANLVHDGSEEVLAAFPADLKSGKAVSRSPATAAGYRPNALGAESRPSGVTTEWYGDEGSAARFYYTAKADADDRIASKHPTVKPVDLMRWLVRLVTPPGGTVLDCFAGTGTTGEACFYEGFNAILIERELEYIADIERRMKLILAGPDERKRAIQAEKAKGKPIDAGPLFSETP